MKRLVAVGFVKSPYPTQHVQYATSDPAWKPKVDKPEFTIISVEQDIVNNTSIVNWSLKMPDIVLNFKPPVDHDLIKKIKLESRDDV